MGKLDGKVAIVSGGARGMGAAEVRRLHADGASVVAADVLDDDGKALADEGHGWKMVDDGSTAFEGDIPVNPSGGVLSSNPIGASGMCRFAEAALQVRGMAGEHQVDGARKALGHAYGGGAQFFAMWIVGSEKP